MCWFLKPLSQTFPIFFECLRDGETKIAVWSKTNLVQTDCIKTGEISLVFKDSHNKNG
jgi:hypothetical protein